MVESSWILWSQSDSVLAQRQIRRWQHNLTQLLSEAPLNSPGTQSLHTVPTRCCYNRIKYDRHTLWEDQPLSHPTIQNRSFDFLGPGQASSGASKGFWVHYAHKDSLLSLQSQTAIGGGMRTSHLGFSNNFTPWRVERVWCKSCCEMKVSVSAFSWGDFLRNSVHMAQACSAGEWVLETPGVVQALTGIGWSGQTSKDLPTIPGSGQHFCSLLHPLCQLKSFWVLKPNPSPFPQARLTICV